MTTEEPTPEQSREAGLDRPLTTASLPEVPEWLDRVAAISWRVVAIAVAGAMVAAVLVQLGTVIIPVFLALLFAAAFMPLARRIRRAGGRPGLAAGVVVLVLLTMFGAMGAIGAHAVISQAEPLGEALDQGFQRVSKEAADADLVSDEQADKADSTASDLAGKAGKTLASGLGTILVGLLAVLTTVLLALFVTFFLVKDGGDMWRWIVARFGAGSPVLDTVGRRSFDALAGYVRGVSIVSAADAAMIGLGAWVLGVPFAGAIAVLTFFLAFIPYLGAIVAGTFASLIAVADGGLSQGLWMLAIVLVVQQIEGNFLSPVILGKATALHPVVIALATVAGGAIGGFLGIFVAVPVTAAVVAAFSELRQQGFFGAKLADPDLLTVPPPGEDPPPVAAI